MKSDHTIDQLQSDSLELLIAMHKLTTTFMRAFPESQSHVEEEKNVYSMPDKLKQDNIKHEIEK